MMQKTVKGFPDYYSRIGTALFVIILLIAEYGAPEAYLWQFNTIGQLGGQNYPQSWLMNSGFLLFGFVLSIGIWMKFKKRNAYLIPELFVLGYALSLMISAYYQPRSFEEHLIYDRFEDSMNHLISSIAGISISLAILTFSLVTIDRKRKIRALLALIVLIAISITKSFHNFPEHHGLLQRVTYLIVLSWLWFDYPKIVPLSTDENK